LLRRAARLARQPTFDPRASGQDLTITIDVDSVDSITRVPAAEWDALAGEDNPFLEHAFLAALEESQSVGKRAGCAPRLVLARQAGRLVGAVPAYLKSNSYG